MSDSRSQQPGWADGLDLDNLTPYTHPSAAWTRRGSNLALAWVRPTEMGLQSISALLGWGGTPLTGCLLNWQISEYGQTLPLSLAGRNYRPDMVIERDTAPDLELTVTAVWPARNALAVQFELRDLAGRPRELSVGFDYPGKDCPPTWQGPYPLGESDGFRNLRPGVCSSLEGERPGCWATLFIHQEHGLNIGWVESYVAGMPRTALEITCLTDLSSRMVALAPGGTARFLITLGFGQNRGRARAALQACQSAVRPPWTVEDETRRLLAFLNAAPPPAPRYAANAAYTRLYAHALAALDGLFIQGEGGYTGDRHVPWTTTDLLAIAFFWDTSFSCLGAREFSPQLCQEAISCFVDNPTPRGSLPGTLCDTHRAGEGQSPIMSWAAWHVYQRSHDRRWLAAVYPGLAGYCRYWFKYHSSPRGLPQFYNAGQVADNDVRWDPIYKREIGNEPVGGVESPDLAAFHVVEMQCLGHMAAELGLTSEAAAWHDKAAWLAKMLVETMYFPEDAMFYDVKEGTHEKYSGVKNPNMFLPLWAGVPLPDAEICRIIEGHMLNPVEFFRELPFPSVSYDNPNYDPGGYWRGRVWPHVVYWMIQTLWRHGYHAEAELTADRVIALFQRTPWFHENYHSGTGAGWDDARLMGFPDYNWSCATAIELLLERYKDPIV
jgi:hypothetical protein